MVLGACSEESLYCTVSRYGIIDSFLLAPLTIPSAAFKGEWRASYWAFNISIRYTAHVNGMNPLNPYSLLWGKHRGCLPFVHKPVATYGCESWTIKKAERQRTDAFELGCWRRLLTVPWTARRSNQSILKEISPEYSLEKLMLKLKLQYFGHLIKRANSFEKTLMLWKVEGERNSGRQRMRWLDGINGHESEQTPGVGHGHGSLGCYSPWGCWVKHNWATELNYLTESSDMAPQCLSTKMVLEFFFCYMTLC